MMSEYNRNDTTDETVIAENKKSQYDSGSKN